MWPMACDVFVFLVALIGCYLKDLFHWTKIDKCKIKGDMLYDKEVDYENLETDKRH